MASITLRSLKGSPLTITEMDDNFSNINTELGSKLDVTSYTASDILTKLKTVDGATSGLDADLVDGLNPDITATGNTIAARDGSGRLVATTFTGNLTGNVTGNVTGDVTGNLTGNVTGNVSGTALNVTGVVALAKGGTGATDAAAARTNLGLGSLATLSTITSAEITNGTIAQADMAANSVGTSQIIDSNVTTAKINNAAVTEAKIANNAVTGDKIASGAVSADELNVVGNGTAGQFLSSDGDGSMTWTTQTPGIGVGQTWQNVTGSRALNTTYTNTTGRPIMISIYCAGQPNNCEWELLVGGVQLGHQGVISVASAAMRATMSAIVPAGSTYRANNISNAGLQSWAELR